MPSTPTATNQSGGAQPAKAPSTSPSAAQLAYDCIQYQSQTSSALYTATNGIISSTQSAANSTYQQSFPTPADRVNYVNQLYTAANSALKNAYNTYISGFKPDVPNCAPNAAAPIYFTLL